jgi:hypothetical protein
MASARPILASLAALAVASAAAAQSTFGGGYQPSAPTADAVPELEGVTIVDKLDSQVPLDAAFRDEAGRAVTFRDVPRRTGPRSCRSATCAARCSAAW